VVELVVLQAGASAIHRRGRGGHDVDDRWLGGHQPRAHCRLTGRILGHERIGVPLFRQQYRHGTGSDNDTAAADSDEQIGPHGSGGINAMLHRRPAGVLIHGIKGPGIQRSKLILDAL
jgi:hypothetical protein